MYSRAEWGKVQMQNESVEPIQNNSHGMTDIVIHKTHS